MKKIVFTLILAFGAALYPGAIQAACSITIEGTRYTDSDCDGAQDLDSDREPVDNCRTVRNGDCDADMLDCDINDDGVTTEIEIVGGNQRDWDHDGTGDACDDSDEDAVPDYRDNCKMKPNPTQNQSDCIDSDNDGIDDDIDNCRVIWNPSQDNSDNDSLGDSCDICAFVDNEDQSQKECSSSSGGGGAQGPVLNESPSPKPPDNSGGGAEVPDHATGSGGCSVIADASGNTWQAIILFSAILLIPRRHRKN